MRAWGLCWCDLGFCGVVGVVGVRTYVLEAFDYDDAIAKLRRLRRKGAVLRHVIIVASVDDHRRIQSLLNGCARQRVVVVVVNG